VAYPFKKKSVPWKSAVSFSSANISATCRGCASMAMINLETGDHERQSILIF